MHRIELGTNEGVVHFIIVEANRKSLKLIFEQDTEVVRTDDYVTFGRDLTESYHRLSGVARLQNESGRTILRITFHKGSVDVSIDWGQAAVTFVTDQSYLTKTVGQVGLFE